jgi:hypothetical protein
VQLLLHLDPEEASIREVRELIALLGEVDPAA